MRILEVTEASGSGTLAVVRSIAERAAREGHEVVLAYGTRPETPDRLGVAPIDGLHLAALPWHDRRPGTQLAAVRELRRVVAGFRPDVMHLHSTFAGIAGALALDGGRPRVYTPHAWASERTADGARTRVYRAVERLIARRCDVVGAVSESEAAAARALGARRVAVVPNGLPELDPGRLPAARERLRARVCGAGRVGPQRRPEACARILSAVAAAAEVEWIGGAPAGEDAPLRAAGVHVTGWLDQAEGLDRLAECTALLHWSAWDGQPLAVLEAFARDVVVVASDIPANRELVGPHQVCATEAEAIALLRRVIEEPDLREQLLAAQRERREAHGATRMTSDWLALYESCAPGHAPARPVQPFQPSRDTPTIERSWS
jgi:glycosyltransferase involved in cell wall biosynthesis